VQLIVIFLHAAREPTYINGRESCVMRHESGTHLHTERTPNVMLPHPHIDFYMFNKF
jgi:hypothetical protein